MAEVRGNVVVTSVVPYGDDDVVVRLFARDHGRFGAFARKARASKRRFPSLAAPSTGAASWKAKHGRDLVELLELDVDPGILALGQDLRGFAHAGYVCELVERLVAEGDPAPEIFDVVTHALRLVCAKGPSATLLRSLELKLLALTGYLPDLVDDVPLYILASTPLDALPGVDDEALRRSARLFGAHLGRLGGPPLKSVRFLHAVVAGSEPSR